MSKYAEQLYFSEDRHSDIVIEDSDARPVARVQALSPGVVRIEVIDNSWAAVDSPTLTVSSRPVHMRGALSGNGTTIGDGTISLSLGETHIFDETHIKAQDTVSAESYNRRRIVSALTIELDSDCRDSTYTANPEDNAHTQHLEEGNSSAGRKNREARQLRLLDTVEVPSEGIRLPRSPFDSRTPDACRSGIWYFRDAPRVVSPWETLSAVLTGNDHARTRATQWRVDRFAGDWYVFAWRNDPAFLRREFLNLTGRIPLPPLWMFGIWHSRYYPYTASQVLELVDEYRQREFPLDVFVIDTDWRQGASRGYRINDKLFDDMEGCLRECHDRRVRVMFNDHPEHLLRSALDEGLLKYREHHLQRLQDMGLDGWWFDRNWRQIFLGPDRGVESSVWGQFVYWEIDRRRRGHGRVPLLSMRTDHPAGHRYPIWWTGDIYSDWDSLAEAIEETVDSGTQLFPYTGQDIGGHIGFPSPEQYVRWIQWATVSPIFRLHCGPRNREREPWKFGVRSEAIALAYTKLRMRLIPLLYSAGREATVSGTPLLRDAALSEPEFAQRERNLDPGALADQFFLGQDLWVAPVHTAAATGGIAGSDASGGRVAGMNDGFETDFHQLEGDFTREVFAPRDPFQGVNLTGDFQPASDARLIERSHTHEIRLSPTWASRDRGNWGNDFFVRWRGSCSVPQNGWYRFVLTGSGTKQLRIGDDSNDDNFPAHVIAKFDKGRNEVHVHLSAARHYPIEVGYHQRGPGITSCYLSCRQLPSEESLRFAPRTVLLPPGDWVRLGTGERYSGGTRKQIGVSVSELPIFMRDSSILPLASPARNTQAIDWSKLTLHIRPPSRIGDTVARTLFTDNGEQGPFADENAVLCTVRVTRVDQQVLEVATRGSDDGEKSVDNGFGKHATPTADNSAQPPFARFVVLLHLQPGEYVRSVFSDADGEPLDYSIPVFEENSGVPLARDGALTPDAQSVRFTLVGPGAGQDLGPGAGQGEDPGGEGGQISHASVRVLIGNESTEHE